MRVRSTRALVGIVIVALAVTGCTARTSGATEAEAQAVQSEGFIALQLSESNSDFALYARQQAERLNGGTIEFANAFSMGDDDLARALYAPTRIFYNRLLPVADSFSDLAGRIDEREVDNTLGASFTGWHAIEQQLYPTPTTVVLTTAERAALADGLVNDTHDLSTRIEGLRPSVDQQTTGAATMMATFGVNAAGGSQDPASHSDLSDLQGYVDGAQVVFRGIRDLLVTQDAALATRLDHEFEGVQDSLNAQRLGVTFKPYDQVPPSDLASLQTKVAALAESLGRVTATLGQ